ncbi:MAG TPA: hypothetical protein VN436_01735 [Holophaga sp.]|nr:hypothetical protein [Holophaga sp.]
MFESQQFQMQSIWLSGHAEHQARLQAGRGEDGAGSVPILGRAFAALRRLSTRHGQAPAAACGTSSLRNSLQACC